VLKTGASATTAVTIDTSQNVTFVGSQTFSGGTANGVLYLNGSKVVTSGSALVFNGTNLSLGSTSSVSRLYVKQSNNTSSGGGLTIENSANDTRLFTYFNVDQDAWVISASYDTNGAYKPFAWYTSDTRRMTLDASGNLGLGVIPSAWSSTASKALQVDKCSLVQIDGFDTSSLSTNAFYNGSWRYIGTAPAVRYDQYSGSHRWQIAPSGTAGNTITFTQAMTLNASRQLLINTTSTTGSIGDGDIILGATTQNQITFQVGGVRRGYIYNSASETSIGAPSGGSLRFQIDGGGTKAAIDTSGNFTVGAYGGIAPSTYGWDLTNSSFTYLGIFQGANALFFLGSSYTGQPRFQPATDNYYDIGFSSGRFKTIYAATGTINTSDANEKQDIDALSDAELRVATAIKSLIKKFRFKDAVVKKGNEARIHVGFMAQDVAAAFVAEGLEPSKYALFCSDTWYAVDGNALDKDAKSYTAESEGAVEVTRLGLRYDELLAFVIAAL
jgi:hypothetical protein